MILQCCPGSKFRKVTHVIFDLDGTILDTEQVYCDVIRQIGEEYGKTFTPQMANMISGSIEVDTANIAIREMNLPLTADEFLLKFRTMANERLPNVPFMPGADKIIRHLYVNGIPIAVATSSTQESLDIKTQNYRELFGLFNHIVCGSTDPEVKQGKPHPDIFLICASRFPNKPDPADCLVFEDAPNGVAGALKAGMQVIMIPNESVPYEIWNTATLRLDSFEGMVPQLFGLPPFPSEE